MHRRDFITLLGGAAAWPLAARAQGTTPARRIGVLWPGEDSDDNPTKRAYHPAFVRGLEELGWVDGRNLRIDLRWGAGNVERMKVLAQELIDLKPDVIVVSSQLATRAALDQTRSIPIVFVFAGDPIDNGYLGNIARPEGNITGVTDLFPSIGGKWVELLKEAKPSLNRIALVFNSDLLTSPTMTNIEAAAAAHGIAVTRIMSRGGSAEIGSALEAFAGEPGGGVILVPPVRLIPGTFEVVSQVALRHGLATISNTRADAAGGFLMSYGADIVDLFRRGAPSYVDRILRGAKVSELPVQFSTKFELVINLKTARTLGLEVPPLLLARADDVIE
jgi:putative ABC transport system substrate-binding protein